MFRLKQLGIDFGLVRIKYSIYKMLYGMILFGIVIKKLFIFYYMLFVRYELLSVKLFEKVRYFGQEGWFVYFKVYFRFRKVVGILWLRFIKIVK